MKKRVVAGAIAAGLLLVGAVNDAISGQTSNTNTAKTSTSTQTPTKTAKEIKPTCDGTSVTTGCVLGDVSYKTYIYHPAVAEKTHEEAETTYREEVTGYCTLCVDGTYSPSCATGRGACSHHGGVAQWNAPMTARIPVNTTKTVVETPAQEAYYEKVLD